MLLHAFSDMLHELLLNGFLDNKNNLLKSSLNCIIDRKIHDNVAVLINWIDLLQTAITASHSCCHYH